MAFIPDELLTGIEVANRLRVTPVTVRAWRSLGVIKGIRLGRGSYRYEWSDVVRSLKRASVKATA